MEPYYGSVPPHMMSMLILAPILPFVVLGLALGAVIGLFWLAAWVVSWVTGVPLRLPLPPVIHEEAPRVFTSFKEELAYRLRTINAP